MSAILLGLSPGDEVIMPSYTFVSTANAFALRGVIPVFADINPITFNLDETAISRLITKKTRAIVPVHYAGVSCEMDSIMEIAGEHDLVVVEDAAQGLELHIVAPILAQFKVFMKRKILFRVKGELY